MTAPRRVAAAGRGGLRRGSPGSARDCKPRAVAGQTVLLPDGRRVMRLRDTAAACAAISLLLCLAAAAAVGQKDPKRERDIFLKQQNGRGYANAGRFRVTLTGFTVHRPTHD